MKVRSVYGDIVKGNKCRLLRSVCKEELHGFWLYRSRCSVFGGPNNDDSGDGRDLSLILSLNEESMEVTTEINNNNGFDFRITMTHFPLPLKRSTMVRSISKLDLLPVAPTTDAVTMAKMAAVRGYATTFK